MAKTRSFSIFLLKANFSAPAAALKADHGLTETTSRAIGSAAHDAWPMFVATKAPTAPWWRDYFNISTSVGQSYAGAIVFVKAAQRTFALTFGQTRHYLRDEAYEYDFGLLTTLNAVDPAEIRNTDELDPATARRRRTQLPEHSDINYFDFDGDNAVLRSLTGAIRPEHRSLFSHATGASNLRVSTKTPRSDLPTLLAKIYDLYQKDTYRTAFPAATNIQPVKDPATLALLDANLEQAVSTGNDDVLLTIPEIVDFQEDFEVSFSGVGPSSLFPDASMQNYLAYLEANDTSPTVLTLDDIRRHRLCLTTNEGVKRGDYSIYRACVFETTLDGRAEAFHLSEGTWYCVDANYLSALSAEVDPLFTDLGLPTRIEHLEAGYNELQLLPHWPGSVLLDRSNTSPPGQKQVEPCDVARHEDDRLVLTHVKFGVSASSLSHLFNQGTNAVELLTDDPDARAKLRQLLLEGDATFNLSGLDGPAFKVEYVIVTKNDSALKSAALPLFSRISLRRARRTLTRMKTDVIVALVDDAYTATPRSKPRKKPQKRTTSAKPHNTPT